MQLTPNGGGSSGDGSWFLIPHGCSFSRRPKSAPAVRVLRFPSTDRGERLALAQIKLILRGAAAIDLGT
jgi:hypothetical protein